MKNFDNLWKQITDKDSRLLDDKTKIEIKSAALKSLLRQFYEKGAESRSRANEFVDRIMRTSGR